ncbi:MAG: amidohydrolase family protein [Chlorobaculum sp.]|nr:amidohydrolase family protein [Chlorobaculum sp.]
MMNLSHPNLTAIIKRIYNDNVKPKIKPLLLKYAKTFKMALVVFLFVIPAVVIMLLLTDQIKVIKLALYFISALLLGSFVMLYIKFGNTEKREKTLSQIQSSVLDKAKEKLGNVMNLLAIMETDIGDCLIQMEEDLRNNLPLNSSLVISGNGEKKEYEKIVLTPLIMDFGLKDSGKTNLTYKVRWKPIVAQVEDLFIGIRDYYRHRNDYVKGHPEPLFQIIPFMGINTKNYTMRAHGDNSGASMKLEDVLKDNFEEFGNDLTHQQRRKNIDAIQIKWKDFNGNIESIGSHCFLGIKVYPPLGFDPWPENSKEKDKVRHMYKYCVDNNIPITAHCSPGGFLVDKSYKEFSSPFKWESVLKEYRNLRLNLAHFGGVESEGWRRKIADMILEIDPKTGHYTYENFYTDISYQGVNKKSYHDLKAFLDTFEKTSRRRLVERIIFGTDFMINLQDISAYSAYLNYFFETDTLTLEEKDMLCNKNAERFLFLG